MSTFRKLLLFCAAAILALCLMFAVPAVIRTLRPPPPEIFLYPQSDAASQSPTHMPKLTEELSEISRHDAGALAAEFFGLRRNALKFTGERIANGNIPVYTFSGSGPCVVEVTKNGGFVASMRSAKKPLSDGLSVELALIEAERALLANEFRDMRLVGHEDADNKVRAVFVYSYGGVTYYQDRVEVIIGRDLGGILGFDALQYITYHHARELPKAKVTEKAAREKLPESLSVTSHGMALLPGDVFCHEFRCEDGLGNVKTMFVNAETGELHSMRNVQSRIHEAPFG